jgi:Fe-S cluster assembly iron-binding protein IscA
VADPGWTFAGWSGGLGSAAEITTTLTGDTVITPTFTQDEYTLDVHIDPAAGGSVVVDPDQTTYLYGDVVTLTATAADGWYFAQWEGQASGTVTQTAVTMTSDKVVTATFVATPPTYYTLTLDVIGSGVITPAVGAHSYLSGTRVDLSANPASGWQFDGWSGALESMANPVQVMLDADKIITATFSQTPPPTYTLDVRVQGNGSVAVDPDQTSYISGTEVTLTPQSDTVWYFTGWTGDLDGAANPAQVTMDADKIITATFSQTPPPTYTLDVRTQGGGSVAVDPDRTSYISGTEVTLTAEPATNWYFTGWSGALGGAANPAQVTMDADKIITATFALSSTANTPPTISLIDDQTTYIGVPVGPLAFTIGDAETAPADLTLAKASSNPALVSTANIAFSGSGADRAVTITPTAGASGIATLSITVSDGDLDTRVSFVLTVRPYQIYLPLVQRE